MKIALCGRFHSKKRYQGGSAEVFLSLAKELSKRHDLTLFGRGEPTEDIKKMCDKLQVKYHWIPADSYIEILISPVRAFLLFLKYLGGEEIIHTHTGCFAFASAFFRKRRKIVINIHEYLEPNNRPLLEKIYACLETAMLLTGAKYSDLVVVNSNYLKSVLLLKKIKNIVVISNWIDTNLFTKSRVSETKNIFNEGKLKLLFVGRLVQMKGLIELIASLKYITDLQPQLLIAGEGCLQNYIKDIVNKTENIKLVGLINHDDLPKYYSAADLTIIPSYEESFGLVPLESLACNTPVLVSNNSGLKETITPKIGHLINKIEPQIIADAIRNTYKSINRQIDYRKYVIKNYSFNKIITKYENEYKKLLKNNKVIVTISWDDGRKRDFKLVNLLKKYGLKGTFYVSPQNREWKKSELMSEKEIKLLSKNFEIGAHSMTHPVLTNLNKEEAYKEIYESKTYLEKTIKNRVDCFCYPRGTFNKKIKILVKKAGFMGARTVTRHCLDFPKDPFAFGTSIHTYNQKTDLFKILKFSKYNLIEFYKNLDWEHLSKKMFDYVMDHGGTFHLWGHSWEMDKYNHWNKLENVLAYISNRKNVNYLTNREVLNISEVN